MNKSAIFLLAIFLITLLACVSSKTSNLKHKKFLKSKSHAKILSQARNERHITSNFTNLYPIIDTTYEEAWSVAEQSDLDMYYFCQNLTLAKQIHDAIHQNITGLYDILDQHREELAVHGKDLSLRINNKNSSYPLNDSITQYDKFLGELSMKYQNEYMEATTKIEAVMEKNKNITDDLSLKCEPHQNAPKQLPKKDNENGQKNNSTNEGEKSAETISFMELKAKAKSLSREERRTVKVLIQMHDRVSKIVNKYFA